MFRLHLPLRPLALICHAALFVAVCGWVLRVFPLSPAREISLAVAALPLLVTVPGLVRGRSRVQQWLTVLLVAYAGGAAVEVVASAGAAYFGSLALLASLFELALLLAIIRQVSAASRARE